MCGIRLVSLFGALALAVLVAACGGSGYTRHDFMVRADAICASALTQARSIAPGTSLSSYLAHYVPVLESEASQLQALRRPPDTASDRATLEHYYAALRQTVAEYRQLAAATKSGDQQAVTNAEAALGASPVYSLATSYGLRSCGTPGSTAV
jgi:predicted NBD/HSP70 family sugar kinase